MGANQEKRQAKNTAHAHRVWERAQIRAAQAQKSINEAYELVKRNSAELTDQQMLQIETEVDRRHEDIVTFLMDAKNAYIAKVGEANAKLNG
jgi:hypothetical protein